MAPNVLDDARLTAIGLLFEVHDGLTRRLAEQLSEHGLPPAEFEVLLRLARSPGGRLRMSDLAAQVSLSAGGLTRLVDRLERRGLAERAACPTDRRGAFAVVTPEGRRLVEKAVRGHVELIERWYTGLLEPAELAAVSSALRKVRAAVHPGADAGTTPAAASL